MSGKAMKDMTKGSPMKLILGFLIPMLFGLLFQQFYSMMDTIIVGKYLGVRALASVGSTGSINFMIIGFCMGICSGFSIPVAQKFGEKNERALRRYVANSGYLAAGFAVVMTAAVCVLCRDILRLMRTPEDIIDGAYSYIFVIFLGIPATYLYNLLSCTIRSLGDSTTPLIFLVFSSVVNVALDFFTILVLKMGVSGAAWATITAQAVSGILCLFYMRKKFDILKMNDDEWRPDAHYMKILCNMGIPMGLQYSITAIGSVILQTSVNTLGALAVASVTAAGRVNMFFTCPFEAMGSTMATYGGQNVGAKKLERLGQGLKSCTLLGVGYALLAFGVMYLFGDNLASLFVETGDAAVGAEILANARLFLTVNSAAYIALAMVNIFRLMIQGIGFSTFAILAGVFEMVARSLVGLVLVPRIGFLGVCFSNPLAWISATAFLVPAYCHVRRKLDRMMNRTAPDRPFCSYSK